VDEQDWDVSVRSIAYYRTVIGMMADKIDWTTSLGQAYVNQSTDVELSVQHLRRLARTVGNLQSSEQQEVLEHDNYIAITPYQPEYVYVPVYDPRIIYYRRPYCHHHWRRISYRRLAEPGPSLGLRRWLGRPLLHWVAQRRLGQWLLELRMDRAQPRTREFPKQRLRQQPL